MPYDDADKAVRESKALLTLLPEMTAENAVRHALAMTTTLLAINAHLVSMNEALVHEVEGKIPPGYDDPDDLDFYRD